ncbi:MAG: hypothetical protein LUD72_04760 [Bacteroidales bacterium]|nr:hypothetical protein [Bacteroidales bacterium]
MCNEALDRIEDILNDLPEKKVKIAKKERGLYEREEKVTLITEDNKLLLND